MFNIETINFSTCLNSIQALESVLCNEDLNPCFEAMRGPDVLEL